MIPIVQALRFAIQNKTFWPMKCNLPGVASGAMTQELCQNLTHLKGKRGLVNYDTIWGWHVITTSTGDTCSA